MGVASWGREKLEKVHLKVTGGEAGRRTHHHILVAESASWLLAQAGKRTLESTKRRVSGL